MSLMIVGIVITLLLLDAAINGHGISALAAGVLVGFVAGNVYGLNAVRRVLFPDMPLGRFVQNMRLMAEAARDMKKGSGSAEDAVL